MDSPELYELFQSLTQRQMLSSSLICAALRFHRPGDDFMLSLYDAQDQLHCHIRAALHTVPGAEPELLEVFDELLYNHRLNLLLLINQLHIPASR